MKKKLLVQLAIIITGIFISYKTFDQFLGLLFWLLNDNSRYYSSNDNTVLYSFLLVLIYFAAAFLTLRYSGKLADLINRNTLTEEDEELAGLRAEPVDLIRAGLILIAVTYMIAQADTIFSYILTMFRSEGLDNKDTEDMRMVAAQDFKSSLFRFVIAFLILYFAGPLAKWANRASQPVSPASQTKPESDPD